MDKLVMGYWDCQYCGTSHIKGTKRDCPNCDHPRDAGVKFYNVSARKPMVFRPWDEWRHV